MSDGFLSPQQIQSLAISVMVVVMMFGIGLRSEPADFRRAAAKPVWFGIQGVINFVAIPALAMAGFALVDVPHDVQVGVILCVAAPGGAVGPLFASNARGDLAVAVADMVILSLGAAFLTPWLIALLLGSGDGFDTMSLVVPMMATLFGVQLLPLALGMVLRRRSPDVATRWARPVQRASNLILMAVVVGLMVSKWSSLGTVGWSGVALCLGVSLACLVSGAALGPDAAWRRSFGMVAVVRNIGVALLLSALWFPAALTDATVLTFGLCTLLLPAAVGGYWARRPLEPV